MNTMQALHRAYVAAAAADLPRTPREFDAITDYMKASTAIHHGEYVRTCYMPKLLPASVFAQFAADIRVLYGILAKVMRAYYRDAAYRALFGFDAVTEELILRADPSRTLLPMARIDFFYNEETGAYQYCEFNTDGTSAMNEDRELNLAQQRSTVYKGFCAAHSTRTCELFDSWVHTLRGICDNYYEKSAAARILFDPAKEQPFTVVRPRAGSYADGARLLRDAEAALAAGESTVRAECVRVAPAFGEEEALRSVTLLSSFTTYFNEGNAPRAHNIARAAEAVSGCVLGAGESFSFNARTGVRTAENGYREAPIIKEGKYVPGVGGGVCQVSTTLYNAALLAGLTVTEHHAHSLPVGYVEPSFDAMVSGKSCDLKLRNDLAGKVYFVLRVRGNALRVRIYGQQSGVTYERESVTTGTIDPPEPEVRADAEESELRAGKAGLTSEGYLIRREKGKPAVRTLLRKDRYAPQRAIVREMPADDAEGAEYAEKESAAAAAKARGGRGNRARRVR